jgi:flotillin
MVIAQLPEMLRAAAQGLQGANVTVLDGAEGLNSVVASLVAQGSAMLETIRAGLRTTPPGPGLTPLNGNRVEGRPIV